MPWKSSGYCSLICAFDLMILIFLGVPSWGMMGLEFEVGWTSFTSCYCCVDVDCACISFLG